LTYEKLFRIHLKEHPRVLKVLVMFARRELRRGRSRTSIRKLWEMARDFDKSLGGLNDHLHSHYARHIMEQNPSLDGMFYTRRLRAA
jgi:hypothetical protein